MSKTLRQNAEKDLYAEQEDKATRFIKNRLEFILMKDRTIEDAEKLKASAEAAIRNFETQFQMDRDRALFDVM